MFSPTWSASTCVTDWFFAGGMLTALSALTAPAQALATSLTYTLTCPIGGPPCGSTVFATVTLTNGADGHSVDVSETLATGNVYAGGGAGDALAFNVDKAVTLSNILPSGTFVQDLSPKGVPYGTFGYAVDYTGNGTSPPNFTSFSFTTNDGSTLTVQDFVANAAGYFFTSDIGVPKAGGGFNTGNVASNGSTIPTPAPEPASMAL